MANVKKLNIKPTAKFPTSCHGREHWIEYLVKQNGWIKGAELGVWRGRTFLHLLRTCPNLTVIGVDIWQEQLDNKGPETYKGWTHSKFEVDVRNQAKKFGERAIILKMWTNEAVHEIEDQSLDFIFVDADHSTEAVRADITNWWPKVKDTGWIIGHDINWETVYIVAEELLPGYVVGPDNAWGRTKVVS